MKAAAIVNPEQEFDSVPKKLSAESSIIRLQKEEGLSNIVLDSIEECVLALQMYDRGVPKAGATQQNLLDAVEQESGTMGVGLALLAGLHNSNGFIGRLCNDLQGELSARGRFYRSFDYDAMGTNFFKTTVEAKKEHGKYLLSLNAAYVGDEPEINLAAAIQKPRALYWANINATLSLVDEWWFNIDLRKALKKIPIQNKKIESLAAAIADRDSTIAPDFTFSHDGKNLNISLGMDNCRYLRSQNGKGIERYYLHAREDYVVGGSWTTWDEKGNIIPARPEEPSLSIILRLQEGEVSRPAVTEEEKNALRSARDYISELLPVSFL